MLHEPGLKKEVAINRAKVRIDPAYRTCMKLILIPVQAIMSVGAVFKATVPDESDEERRELER